MREAAANLEFEEAARLRDELKRLQATELAISDDPLARQGDVEREAGRYGGSRKYGRNANLPPKGLPPPAEGAAAGDEDSACLRPDRQGPLGRGHPHPQARPRRDGPRHRPRGAAELPRAPGGALDAGARRAEAEIQGWRWEAAVNPRRTARLARASGAAATAAANEAPYRSPPPFREQKRRNPYGITIRVSLVSVLL